MRPRSDITPSRHAPHSTDRFFQTLGLLLVAASLPLLLTNSIPAKNHAQPKVTQHATKPPLADQPKVHPPSLTQRQTKSAPAIPQTKVPRPSPLPRKHNSSKTQLPKTISASYQPLAKSPTPPNNHRRRPQQLKPSLQTKLANLDQQSSLNPGQLVLYNRHKRNQNNALRQSSGSKPLLLYISRADGCYGKSGQIDISLNIDPASVPKPQLTALEFTINLPKGAKIRGIRRGQTVQEQDREITTSHVEASNQLHIAIHSSPSPLVSGNLLSVLLLCPKKIESPKAVIVSQATSHGKTLNISYQASAFKIE